MKQFELYCQSCKKPTINSLTSRILKDKSCTHNYSVWHYWFKDQYTCNSCGSINGQYDNIEIKYTDLNRADTRPKGELQ